MDNLKKTRRQYHIRLLIAFFISGVLPLAVYIGIKKTVGLHNEYYGSAIALALVLLMSLFMASILARSLITPLKTLWELIISYSPHSNVQQPKIETLKIGREMVANLSMQVFKLASAADTNQQAQSAQLISLSNDFVANKLPLPLFVLDASETIIFANTPASDYVGMPNKDIIGKNFYMVMDMSFPSENTLDHWLKEVTVNTATASTSWERVKLNVLDNHPTRLFDLAAFYNKDNPNHYETMLVLFDHTKQYSQDDQAISFVALSVHELRTPLTLLRGYIEALDDELDTKNSNDPELKKFMENMRATAQQLTAFVNNILNVARVNNDQLELELHEENWAEILNSAVNAIRLRAKVRGIEIETTIAPDLPTVGVDRLSIYEVISNLIDNAIKYSGESKTIKIESHLNNDGMVETNVQDFGLGISSSIMPNLFTKFYRDHRNRSQIGGTGLGLYLSKAIVDAHGGVIWVRSTIGKGSIFGFTLIPFTQLAEEIKNSDNKDIVRGAHGWIKNHSLYRR